MSRTCRVHVACKYRSCSGRVADARAVNVAKHVIVAPCGSGCVARTDEWQRQFLSNMDVERDAIMHLEELMFENSSRAEVSGYRQWGLQVTQETTKARGTLTMNSHRNGIIKIVKGAKRSLW